MLHPKGSRRKAGPDTRESKENKTITKAVGPRRRPPNETDNSVKRMRRLQEIAALLLGPCCPLVPHLLPERWEDRQVSHVSSADSYREHLRTSQRLENTEFGELVDVTD